MKHLNPRSIILQGLSGIACTEFMMRNRITSESPEAQLNLYILETSLSRQAGLFFNGGGGEEEVFGEVGDCCPDTKALKGLSQ